MTNFQVIEHLEMLEVKLDKLALLIEGKTPEYYTVRETSELLRCSKSSIRDRMRCGELHFQRLGHSESSPILIRRVDLEGLLT